MVQKCNVYVCKATLGLMDTAAEGLVQHPDFFFFFLNGIACFHFYILCAACSLLM